MEYKKEDAIKLSWEEFDNYMNKIKSDIEKYLDKNDLKIDVIVPILRGGGIPALKLAFDFRVIRILPYQFKYTNDGENSIPIKMLNTKFSQLENFNQKNPVVLIVEGNHSTGNLAKKIAQDIKTQLPKAKIIYVALAKDYKYKDSVKNTVFTTCGFFTNENRKLSEEECDKLNIEARKVYFFPWESYEEELSALNREKFEYTNKLN